MNAWVTFVVSAAAIIFAGRKLSDYGDQIATSTGLGRAWIGAILLAGATSLPEVAASGIAGYQGLGNLAMGNVFGSNIFNILVLAIAQIFTARTMLANASTTHVTTAAAGMLLSGIAVLGMLVKVPTTLLGAGLDTILLAVAYILLLKLLPKEEESEQLPHDAAASVQEDTTAKPGAGLLWLKFAAAAGVIIIAGWFLAGASDDIATATGLGQTFVGGTLLAGATSLPELVVTIHTARQGLYDLAIGNVLGSNIFNMIILLIADFAMPGPPITSMATQGQIVAATVGLILSGIAVIGLTVRNRKATYRFQWDMIAITLAYFTGTYLIFVLR